METQREFPTETALERTIAFLMVLCRAKGVVVVHERDGRAWRFAEQERLRILLAERLGDVLRVARTEAGREAAVRDGVELAVQAP